MKCKIKNNLLIYLEILYLKIKILIIDLLFQNLIILNQVIDIITIKYFLLNLIENGKRKTIRK